MRSQMRDAESPPSRVCRPAGGRDRRAISEAKGCAGRTANTWRLSGEGACACSPGGSTPKHASVSPHVCGLATVTLMIRTNSNVNIIQFTHVVLKFLHLHDTRPLCHSSTMSHMQIRNTIPISTVPLKEEPRPLFMKSITVIRDAVILQLL